MLAELTGRQAVKRREPPEDRCIVQLGSKENPAATFGCRMSTDIGSEAAHEPTLPKAESKTDLELERSTTGGSAQSVPELEIAA